MKYFKYMVACMMLCSVSLVQAQTITPDSLLTPPVDAQPEPETQAPAEPQALEWQPMPRTIVCQSIGFVRQYLEVRGLQQWAVAQTAIGNPDPFNGAIVVRNPATKDFAIVLIQTQTNMACIVMVGGQLLTMEEINQLSQ